VNGLVSWLRGRRRDRLQLGIVINLLATPGLGSWMGGHRLAGLGQLVLSCSGFVLFVGHLVLLVRGLWQAVDLGMEPVPPAAWWWQSALVLFGVGWLWGALTSVQLFREMRAEQQPARLPPKLS
jgi:hypothetical protein